MNKIEKAIEYLRLEKPFKIILVSKPHKEVDGCYWAMRSKKQNRLSHLIKIWMGNDSRSTEATIIHELIHAWQEEKGLTEYHGPEFIRVARELETRLKIKGIYIPGVDIKKPK